jgi:hypothetical protein
MMALLPPEALNEVAQVFTFGAKKYGADNWRAGLSYRRLLSATMRHVNAYNSGEDIDSESGLSHTAHAVANLLMLCEYSLLDLGEDDRWTKK